MQRTLDRFAHFDSRSREYPVAELAEVAGKPLRGYTWECDTWLDQGPDGACVGHAVAHDLAARPAARTATSWLAFLIYHEAQKIDPWPGEEYSGTSVLAGVKIAQRLGHFDTYRWAFGLEDALLAIGYAGPVILGTNWYQGMFNPDADGFLRPTGSVAGGHAVLLNSVNVREEYVVVHNSWGKSWADNGRAKLAFEDLDKLLHEDGEAVVPMLRK